MRNDFREFQNYLVADRYYYEPMERYEYRKEDFLAVADKVRGSGWGMTRRGVWLGCSPEGKRLPAQGWKIHLSARPGDAAEILERTASLLIPLGVPFKFLLDKHLFTLANSKSWPRGSAGKFITVYPSDEKEFTDIAGKLAEATAGFAGPYILSDRRYPGSKTVFYRYGGIRPVGALLPDGETTYTLTSPSGGTHPDERKPYFSLPPWVKDPFPAEDEPGGGLNNGRYDVLSSLNFSNSGGVYLARDNKTGEKVVIKEARPWVNETEPGMDMVALLEKEARLLGKLAKHGIAPRPVETFREWEHFFLAQEYLDGYIQLSTWAMRNTVVLRTRFSRDDVKAFFTSYAKIFTRLAEALEKMHAEGVLFGDFSANNVMVHPDTLEVKIIDLESGMDAENARPPLFITPGFSDRNRKFASPITVEDDYYAFGANMLYALVRVGHFSDLKPDIGALWLDYLSAAIGFPASLRPIVESLTRREPSERKKPVEAAREFAEAIARMPSGAEAAPPKFDMPEPGRYSALADRIVRHLSAAADYGRSDRLWPAAPQVYASNPLGVANGAAGIIKALHSRSPRAVSREMTDWVLGKKISPDAYPPGLASGMSGIAWTLLDAGLKPPALAIMETAASHPLLSSGAGLSYGLAGWGMTNLRFWMDSRDRKFLDRAAAAGREILAMAKKDGDTIFWQDDGGKKHSIGLAHGASGVALFLACLGAASGDAEAKSAAVRALDHDISLGTVTPEGGLSWPRDTGPGGPMLPYFEYGSAGIGAACLRVMKATGEKKYAGTLEKILVDCDRIYSVFPGRNSGMAGIGEFLLDALAFTGDARYKAAAAKLAAGIAMFEVPRAEGAAFPGDGLYRLSCDYASGSAGILSFFDRFETGRPADFMLDGLFN